MVLFVAQLYETSHDLGSQVLLCVHAFYGGQGRAVTFLDSGTLSQVVSNNVVTWNQGALFKAAQTIFVQRDSETSRRDTAETIQKRAWSFYQRRGIQQQAKPWESESGEKEREQHSESSDEEADTEEQDIEGDAGEFGLLLNSL